jgi:WD40 repeat protein
MDVSGEGFGCLNFIAPKLTPWTTSWDETVRRWDRNTGTCFQILRGHSGRIWSMAMTTDGQKIVTGSQDKLIKIWGSVEGSGF